ncbi:hypothetical protein J8281_03680 [Aquimarina sp. U1-2]|uniref:hypothetical protein n=1 Tax=Aquimarina sp. U1-2 TaxID=2823141 RepID=UPI001AEC8AE0|nr:hypothetical protein [Aquimarina sp. U1-2]MBP2831279.1 hypothetical protein [Aquimarina sp. U1-2]
MSIWNKIFKKTKTETIEIENNFDADVIKSIEIIGNAEKSLDNGDFMSLLMEKGIKKENAFEIIIFLPVAFIRRWLNNIDWPVTYIDYYSENNKITKRYSENHQYVVIENEVERYWNNNPEKDFIINIAGRSAEFDAINQLLNDGEKMEDIKIVELVVLRT